MRSFVLVTLLGSVIVAGGCATRLSECPDAGCMEGGGGSGGVNGGGGSGGIAGGGGGGSGGGVDLGFVSPPADLSSQDCQAILFCSAGCVSDPNSSMACIQKCAAGASPQAQTQFAKLLSCIIANCSSDMSGSFASCAQNAVGGPCSAQFAACQ